MHHKLFRCTRLSEQTDWFLIFSASIWKTMGFFQSLAVSHPQAAALNSFTMFLLPPGHPKKFRSVGFSHHFFAMMIIPSAFPVSLAMRIRHLDQGDIYSLRADGSGFEVEQGKLKGNQLSKTIQPTVNWCLHLVVGLITPI